MMPVFYGLADVDGVLCVTCKTPDYNEPRWVINHWPTAIRTLDFLRHYELQPEQLADCKLSNGYPGNYGYRPERSWQQFMDINTIDGGRTESILTTFEPYPKPRTNKPCEYHGGHWHKNMAKGWVRV